MHPDQYPTAHQLAKKLLEGPDHIVVLPRPVFDMPGQWMVLPVDTRPDKIEDRDVIVLTAMKDPEPADETPS